MLIFFLFVHIGSIFPPITAPDDPYSPLHAVIPANASDSAIPWQAHRQARPAPSTPPDSAPPWLSPVYRNTEPNPLFGIGIASQKTPRIRVSRRIYLIKSMLKIKGSP